jgi:hypothetical protein
MKGTKRSGFKISDNENPRPTDRRAVKGMGGGSGKGQRIDGTSRNILRKNKK